MLACNGNSISICHFPVISKNVIDYYTLQVKSNLYKGVLAAVRYTKALNEGCFKI
jgi:hypothetical protein